MKSKSTFVGLFVMIAGIAVVLALSFALKAIGDGRSDDASRSASSGYSRDTKVSFTVENSLATGISITAEGSSSGWNGLKPTDAGAFGGRDLAAGARHSADLVFATTRSRVPFTLTFTSADGAALGAVEIDRDYLKETCTSVTQGKYTVQDCSQVNVWWFAPASAFTESRILGSASSCPSSKNAIDLGEYTDTSGKKQQVKFTLTCSSTTGATTGRLTQTAVTGS